MITIAFKPPTVSPVTDEENEAFMNHNELVTKAADCYIKQIPGMVQRYMLQTTTEITTRGKEMKRLLGPLCHKRIVAGYSNLLFFIREVSFKYYLLPSV